MKILALDFSTSHRSVAVVECNGASAAALGRAGESGTRATHAFRLIEEALAAAQSDKKDVDALAIGLGPGSYGGIRVALSIAQGWQAATGVRTAGVPSSIVLAETARRKGHRGPLNVVVDAQRAEFYLARFRLDANGPHTIEQIRILSRSSLVDHIGSGVRHVGPDLEKTLPGVPTLHPDAAVLAELAFHQQVFVPAEQLEPVYLRATSFVRAPAARTDL